MKHISRTSIVLAFVIFIASCGTGKKLESANMQIQDLQGQINSLTQENTKLKTQITDLTNRGAAMNTEFASYKEQCELQAKKLRAAEDIVAEEERRMEELEKKIDEALTNFKEKGVDVYYDKGYVYVSLAEDLLYKSGSSALGQGGKDALGSLASVLNDYPKLKVVVVGNTDDKQFKKGMDNWTLSTERANGVVRLLRDSYNVDPTRLTAAGKGKYNPVENNSTPEGRAKNRRTDIIINPDLARLWHSTER